MKKRNSCLLLVTVLSLLLCACGTAAAPTVTDALQPTEAPATDVPQTAAPAPAETATPQPNLSAEPVQPQQVEITTCSQGEDAQYVNVLLHFDGSAAALAAEDFSVTLAGDALETEQIKVTAEENDATVALHVTAIRGGVLEMDYTGAAAVPFAVHAIVTPGAALETVSQDAEAATVTARVCALPNVRGVCRVLLLEDGEVVMTQAEEPSQFSAVHCHDFLNLDAAAIAEKAAFSLGESFPEGYTVTSDGDTVTVTKTDAQGPVKLELAVQQRVEIELK